MTSNWSIPEREQALQRTAEEDLPKLALADDVSRLLAEVVQSVSIDAGKQDRDATALRTHALWFMAIITLRALRAAMQALRSGYEDQAVGYQRLIDELHNRAQKLAADDSGEYARQWLEGRGLGKGAKLAGQDFWEFMSGPVHADAAQLLRVPRSTLYELVRSRGLPHVRIGRRGLRFTRADLARWVGENSFGR